jgi:hypothetical protein
MSQEIVSNQRIINKIFLIRNKKVMFDFDLAEMYGAETRVLNQAVKRNIERFPDDFMFQLDEKEFKIWESTILKSQIVISSWGGRRHIPYVFTEQGVAMLSSVLNSKTAIKVNIQIMRTFTKLREILLSHKDLREKLEKMEDKYDQNFKVVFDAIKRLLDKDEKPVTEIGFKCEK